MPNVDRYSMTNGNNNKSNFEEIKTSVKLTRRPSTAMSIEDFAYLLADNNIIGAHEEKSSFNTMTKASDALKYTDKFGFGQKSYQKPNANESSYEFTQNKTNKAHDSFNADVSSSKFNKTRPSTAMNGENFSYNTANNNSKGFSSSGARGEEESSENASLNSVSDTPVSSKLNRPGTSLINNNINKESFGYNKKIKAIAKDLLTFIKEEKKDLLMEDILSEKKNLNNMTKTLVENSAQNTPYLSNKVSPPSSHLTAPVSYKSQMTRTTYELFPSIINKETPQPVTVLNDKFGFKPEPLPVKSSFSPPSPTPSSQQTLTIVESLVNRRAGAKDLEENASSKRVSYMPFTRSTYEKSLSFKNRDALPNNNFDSLIKPPLSQYSPYKPTQISTSFSNISSGSKTLKFEPQKQSSISSSIKTDPSSHSSTSFEVYSNSSKTLIENDRGLAEEDDNNSSSVKNNETDFDSKSSLSQYLPQRLELNVSTMTAKTLKYEPQNILNSPRSLNSSKNNSEPYKELRPDEEKMVLKQGAELAKSQQYDYELGLNSLKKQRIPNKDSFYAMTEPSQKNEAAPFASDSPSKSTLLNNEIELEAKSEQGNNNRLDRASQKMDEIVYKGTSPREAFKPEQKKIQPATKSTVQTFTGLYGPKTSKPLPTLTTIARPSRTILETSKKPIELDKTSKKSFLSTLQSSSSKLGGKTVESNLAANKNSLQIRDVSKTRQSQPSYSSRTITEKPLTNRVSAQVKETPKKYSYMPTKSIIEKPLSLPTKTINESYTKQDLTRLKQPTTSTTKTVVERKSSFGFSKPTPSAAKSSGVIDSTQKKISEIESAIKKSFLQSSNLKNVKPELSSSRTSISSRGSISYMPTQSYLESPSYSRSSTSNKDFSSKIRQPMSIKSVPDKGLNQKQSVPQAKLKEPVSDIRNSYLSTKTTIEKPASYSYSNIISSVSTKPKENTISTVIPVVHKVNLSMPSKTLVEMRSSSSFGFNKPKETKYVNPGLKSSESLIDQLVISLEKHEKEQQKRSKLISHLLGGKTNLDSSKETLSNNYPISTNNSFLTNKPVEENFLDNSSFSNNFDDLNCSQPKENSLVKKDLKKSEPKKVEYSQNFKPKAMPFQSSEQKSSANNNNLKPQGLKSSIFLSKNIQQKQPVNDRKQTNQKGKQPQKNVKQSGYLSCRSRTFSNLDVVFEVEREEYSRCSDDSKSTIKTWSIATNDPERSFSSFEDVKGLPKEENLFPNEEKNDVEQDSSDVVDNCDKPVETDDLQAEQTHISVNSLETTELNDIKLESNSEQKESNNENEIDELKSFLTKMGVICDQCVYDSKSDIIEEIFKSIDKDALGKINVEEALVIFEKINSNKDAYTNEEVENFVRQSDSDSDGFIDLQEFILIFDKF
jgi:hypothetical protein